MILDFIFVICYKQTELPSGHIFYKMLEPWAKKGIFKNNWEALSTATLVILLGTAVPWAKC